MHLTLDDIQQLHQLPQGDYQGMPEGVVILLLDWVQHTSLTRPTMHRRFYEILELYGQCVFLFFLFLYRPVIF